MIFFAAINVRIAAIPEVISAVENKKIMFVCVGIIIVDIIAIAPFRDLWIADKVISDIMKSAVPILPIREA